MSIYGSAVKKPITTLMVFLAVVVFGFYSMNNLPVDLYPEVEPPFLSVYTYYGGASAADIETNLSKPIENNLNSVSNLKQINSVSRDNFSVVTLEFEWETNLDEAANDVRNSLSFIENFLPDDAEDPIVYKFNSSMMPILFYSITADESYNGLGKLLDEKLINPLNRIEGIGSIGLGGSPGREIYVEVDPLRLEAYHLTVEQIGQMIGAENMDMPSGNIEMGRIDYPLRIKGEFKESSEIGNIVIGTYSGQTLLLKDVATVKDSIRDVKIDQRVDGKKAVRMFVMKQSGANTVNIARDVRNEIEKIQKTLPPDVKIEPIFDSSEFIQGSISNLAQTLMWALVFVVLVVLFFLGRWRATFIVALTIPISLIVSFIYLRLTGNSINIISLTSLSIAIGMVVDDAIVVLENITKHIERGSSPREAAIYATNEVWLAVIVTTLTVVAVFLPLTLVSGLTGVLFKQLGWIVTITVVTSTVTAISLTPMLSSKLLKLRVPKEKKRKSLFSYNNTIRVFLNWLDNIYGSLLKWSLKHKIVVSVLSLFIFVGSLMLLPNIGTEFIPEADQGSFDVSVELQTGTKVDETIKVARKVDQLIKETYPEVELISTQAGSDDNAGMSSLFQSTGYHIINFSVRLIDAEERNRSVWVIADDLRERLSEIPDIVEFKVSTSDGMSMGGGNNVEVAIFGYDFNQTTNLAVELEQKIKAIPGATDVNISREDEKPELQIVFDQDKLARHGLNTVTVSTMIRNRVDGMLASRFREEGDEYDIIVRFEEEYRNSITDINNIAIMTSNGNKIRLEEIAEVKEYYSPPNIERRRKERIVTVTAVPFQKSLGQLAADIQNVIDETDIPQDVMVEVGGAYEDQMEAFADLGLLMMLSLLLVYIVMASQFESFKMPFIIMFSIPFAFSGVLIALWLTHTTLSVIAALGAVLLIGIVVKNAIVLVDYINLMRDRGMRLYEAIAVSGRSRLRPVLMTSLTTILGMLPLALSTGDGSEIWSPMGISVIGGLVFSTFITLVIVPVMYASMARSGGRNKKKKVIAKYNFMDE